MTAPRGPGDATPCAWCRERPARSPGRFCGQLCRQAAHRARRRRATPPMENPAPGRFLYLDPPYPELARRYYRDEPSFAGEVDHRLLIARALTGGFVGWALSTSVRALRDLLPLCPPEARVCAWVKPHGVSGKTYGLHNAWEPLIVVGGRRLRPGKRDWLRAQPARFGGSLMGRKPLSFCSWLFDVMGMLPGDELEDWFPGTGVVSRAWAEVSAFGSASPGAAPDDELRAAPGDVGVYVVRNVGTGNVKIGWTGRSVSGRIKTLQQACEAPLELVAVFPMARRRTETALHGRFRALRVRGEWYRVEGELASLIASASPAPGRERPSPAPRGGASPAHGERPSDALSAVAEDPSDARGGAA